MPRRSSHRVDVGDVGAVDGQVPDVGSIIRLIIRIDVVLPQPDGPTKTVSVPAGTSRFSSVDGDGAVGVDLV